MAELKDMKKEIVNRKEAVKFETRYKKIKFVGKSILGFGIKTAVLCREAEDYQENRSGPEGSSRSL